MKSMTGYASKSKEIIIKSEGEKYPLTLVCEMKTLNSKYFELSVSLPNIFFPYEMNIRKTINEKIKRGKIYSWIKIEAGKAPLKVVMDSGILEGVKAALSNEGISDVNAALQTIPFDTLFTIFPKSVDEESIEPLYELISETTDEVNKMREIEGKSTKEDLLRIKNALVEELKIIKTNFDGNLSEHVQSVRENIDKVLEKYDADDGRIYLEAGIISNKLNINEEIKRLESHLNQFESILNENNAVAKKLDFLAQEFLRETNTIASKVQNIEITKSTLNMKTLIDEMKEQVRNIE